MKSAQCPYCKEEIKARATICKHCHERLFWSREERVMAAISERIEITAGTRIRVPSYSICRAHCYHDHKNDIAGLNQCLRGCEAEEAGDDPLWNDTLVLEPRPTIPGSYRLREGFYTIIEKHPDFDFKNIVYQDNALYKRETTDEIDTNYLVFAIGKSPGAMI